MSWSWRGAYSGSTGYAVNDAVFFRGIPYLAIAPSTGAEPDQNPGDWSPLNSAGEKLVEAMAAALNAPAYKPCTTYRTRIDAVASQELPAMVIYAVLEKPEIRSGNRMLRKRTVRLECMVEGEPPADHLVDPLYVFAVVALQADTTLAPLIRKLEETQIIWETVASYQDRCLAGIDFEVTFATELVDATVRV